VSITSGFSLSEVLTAVAVFALGLAGVSSMHITALKLNAKAHDTTQLATIIHQHMEHLLTLPMTDPGLQDTSLALGQSTTYCVSYPPEGIRPCQDASFASAYQTKGVSAYCLMRSQGAGDTACSEASFPVPDVGYKVLWRVDIDTLGNADPQAMRLAYIDLTVSQKWAGTYATSSAQNPSQTTQYKHYSLSFARFSR
jgi:prepilin-type N-terminal cleavage/methylation domain-containing protein